MDGALGDVLARKIEERVNYRILGWFENGFRHISNRVRELRRPRTSAGSAIRVLPSKVQARTFELLGAVPMRMDLTEAIKMIAAGTIDAQENPLSNTVTYGVHKFHRFHTLSNHFYISRPIFLHRTAFDAWPAAPPARHAERVTDAVAFQRGLHVQEEEDARKAIEAQGCEIVELTAAEHDAFARRSASRCSTTRAADLRARPVRLTAEPRGVSAPRGTLRGSVLSAPLVGLREDERPEHLVFGFRRVGRGDAHAGRALEQHVVAVRRRVRASRRRPAPGCDSRRRHSPPRCARGSPALSRSWKLRATSWLSVSRLAMAWACASASFISSGSTVTGVSPLLVR